MGRRCRLSGNRLTVDDRDLVLANESRSLIAGEAVARPVLDHIQRRVRADSRIARVAEIATLHLGPTSVLVALTVAFKPSLTLTDLRAAIRDLTMGPKEVEGRNPHVYLRPILRSGDPSA